MINLSKSNILDLDEEKNMNSFGTLDNNFKLGDFVKIFIDDENVTKIGRIEEIFYEEEEKLIRYNLFLPVKSVESISLDELKNYGKNELLKTDEIEKEFYSSIQEKIEVLKFETFIKKKLSKNKTNDIYYYRQMYSSSREMVYPDLDLLNCCNSILNPDYEYIQCYNSLCRILIHEVCISVNKLINCPSCNFPLKSVGAQIILGKKRSEPEKIIPKVIVAKKEQKVEEKKDFSNLPEENRNYLTQLLSKLNKLSTNIAQKSMNAEEKTRKIIKDELINVLVRFLYSYMV